MPGRSSAKSVACRVAPASISRTKVTLRRTSTIGNSVAVGALVDVPKHCSTAQASTKALSSSGFSDLRSDQHGVIDGEVLLDHGGPQCDGSGRHCDAQSVIRITDWNPISRPMACN